MEGMHQRKISTNWVEFKKYIKLHLKFFV
jgi:hypothetical protein